MEPIFPHLNLLSDFSFMRSGGTPEAFVKAAADTPALGIADIGSMSCVPEFGKATKGTGVAAKAGVILMVEEGGQKQRVRFHGKGEDGWESLCLLQKEAIVNGKLTPAHVEGEAGSIVLILQAPEAGTDEAMQPPAHAVIEALKRVTGDIYAEDLRAPDSGQINSPWLTAIAQHDLPTIAAAPVAYPMPADRDVWRMMGAIAANAIFDDGYQPGTPGCHLLSREEMRALFPEDMIALERAEKLAEEATPLPKPRAPMLPKLDSGNALETLAIDASDGLRRLVGPSIPPRYAERLEMELGVIDRMGFADYFLIVAEFIGWAKSKGIAVGPGRGSGAGSLVAWCVGITGIDPLQHGLLFERFINPERVSLPDFDIDFCELRREEVIAHVRELYGEARVARIATFSTIGGKSAIKDTARILGVHFQEANEISARYPFFAENLQQAMSNDEFRGFIESSRVRRRVIEHAAKLEGLRRQVGMHAAGVIITSNNIAQDAPLFRDPRSGQIVLGYEMKGAENFGLVKFDFLGLSTLSIINEATRLLKKHGVEPPPPAEQIRLDDASTYKMLARGASKGTFQFDRMIEPLRTVRPTQFTDLVAINALNRPGPMQFIPLYAERKRAAEKGQGLNFEVPAPREFTMPILAETFGIMVYQEQVMKIAQVCAGYSLGQADLLRRAIGKKIADELASQRGQFIEGCSKTTGMPAETAGRLFDDIERFADYGFNKSHAEAYALLGYVTAYFKAHHPAAWFAALSTFERSKDRLAELADEVRKLGARILPPSINASSVSFDIEDTPETGWAIRFGLGSIAGVGEATSHTIKSLIRTRREAPFTSLPDLIERGGVDLPKSTLKAFAAAGALDDFGLSRAAATEAVDLIHDLVKLRSAATAAPSSPADLFGSNSTASQVRSLPAMPGMDGLKGWVEAEIAPLSPRRRAAVTQKLDAIIASQEWQDRAAREIDALGYAVSDNPNDALISHINVTGITIPGEMSPRPTGTVQALRDQFEKEVVKAAATGGYTPALRTLSCVEIANAYLTAPRRAGEGTDQPPRLVFHVRDGDDRIKLNMARDKASMDAAEDIARIASTAGLPVVAELEMLSAPNRDGFSRTEMRITKLHPLSGVIFSAPPGALIISADPARSTDPETVMDWERTLATQDIPAIHMKATHYLATLGREVRLTLVHLNSPAGRQAVEADGRPYDGAPSRVVLRCGPSQVILPGQYRLHPGMGVLLRAIAGVTNLSRRPGEAVSPDMSDLYRGAKLSAGDATAPCEVVGREAMGELAEERGPDVATLEKADMDHGGPSYG